MIIKFKKLNPDAKIPNYAHAGDAGMDIYSIENIIIKSNETKTIKTGLSGEIEEGYVVYFWGKSGLAQKGIDSLAGVIDSGYRGEWQVVLHNLDDTDYVVNKGDKIVQAIIQKVDQAEIIETIHLSDSSRGIGGFGSTGIK